MVDIPFSDKVLIPLLDDNKQLMLYDPTLVIGDRFQRIEAKNAIFSAPREVIVTSQAQLETAFGTDIEIPDFTSVTVVIDDSFTLTKPFKIGSFCELEVRGSTTGTTLTYTGTGAMFQNTISTNAIITLSIKDIVIFGDDTNTLYDILAVNAVLANNITFSNFASVGTLDAIVNIFNTVSFQNFVTGLVFRNSQNISITTTSVVQGAATGITSFTIIPNPAVPVNVDMVIVVGFQLGTGESLVFFDPNAAPGSLYTIEKSLAAGGGDLYQPGVDIAIDTVASSGGIAEFTTDGTEHELVVGRPVVLSGFSESTYNGTFIVTAVDVEISGVVFEVAEITFVSDVPGNMNTKSLDNTDALVIADANRGSADSMTIAESSINGTLIVPGALSTEIPIVDVTPVAGDWIQDPSTERFVVDTTTGIVTYIGTKIITVMIKYSMSLEHLTGSPQTVFTDLHINGIVQPKTSITVITSTPIPAAVVYNGGNFQITPGDTFQLFKTNVSNTNTTSISSTNLLINLD